MKLAWPETRKQFLGMPCIHEVLISLVSVPTTECTCGNYELWQPFSRNLAANVHSSISCWLKESAALLEIINTAGAVKDTGQFNSIRDRPVVNNVLTNGEVTTIRHQVEPSFAEPWLICIRLARLQYFVEELIRGNRMFAAM